MTKQKVKAFTILEVTVTMLLTALVIGITYSAYAIVINSYTSFNNKHTDMAVLLTLDHLLKRDFEQAEIVLKDDAGITIRKSNQLVKYGFKPGFIVRSAARIDTFKVAMQDMNTLFEDIPLNEVGAAEKQNRIDELGFTLLFQNEKVPYHYRKSYSSVNLIQRNINAVN